MIWLLAHLPLLTVGRGGKGVVGEELNHTARSLVLYKSFNTLWSSMRIAFRTVRGKYEDFIYTHCSTVKGEYEDCILH
jgi:hypothetical protein